MPNSVKLLIVFVVVGGVAVTTYKFVGPKVG